MKLVLWMLLTISVSGGLLFYVWGKVDVVRAGYELDALLKKKAALVQEHERLQGRFSQLMAPERIASEVGEKLDMRPPDARQVILVPNGSENVKPSVAPLRVARQTGD